MQSTSDATSEPGKLGTFPFVLGGLSFIPLIGILFGVIAIAWGLTTRRHGGKILALVGAGGIGFSVLVYGGLFYFGFVQRGGIYDGLRTRLAQNDLNSLVETVEFYKITHGEYPDSLETLKKSLPPGSFQALYVTDPRVVVSPTGLHDFYYRRVGSDHYYLRGVAADGNPFSPGALVPQVTTSGKLGLLTEPPPASPSQTP